MKEHYCPLHGSVTNNGTCCARAYEVALPKRMMESIPWATRVDARHELQEAHSRCLEVRHALLNGRLDADGAIEDVESIIRQLEGVKRRLS